MVDLNGHEAETADTDKDGYRQRKPTAHRVSSTRKLVLRPLLKRAVTHCKQGVGIEPLFMLRCDRSPVMLTWLRQLAFPYGRCSNRESSQFFTLSETFWLRFVRRPILAAALYPMPA